MAHCNNRKEARMSRSLLNKLLATVAVAAFSFGVAGAASAAPVMTADAHVATAQSLVQPIHWVYHNHHRVWVNDHHDHHH
jgi:hypothetical protein